MTAFERILHKLRHGHRLRRNEYLRAQAICLYVPPELRPKSKEEVS